MKPSVRGRGNSVLLIKAAVNVIHFVGKSNFGSSRILCSPGSAIYARKNGEVNAFFLLVYIRHTMPFNTSGGAF